MKPVRTALKSLVSRKYYCIADSKRLIKADFKIYNGLGKSSLIKLVYDEKQNFIIKTLLRIIKKIHLSLGKSLLMKCHSVT